MKLKTIIVLFIICLGLLTVILLSSFFNPSTKQQISPVTFGNLTATGSTILSITKGKEQVLLERGNVWTVNSYPASLSKVTDFFHSLEETQIKQLVSNNPENQARLGVTDESGYRIAVTHNGTETTMVVGNRGPDTRSFYIRLKNQTEVYQASGDLPDYLTTNTSDWRDKTVVNIDRSHIQKITITRRTGDLLMTRQDTKLWVAQQGKKKGDVSAKKMDNLFSSLSPLLAYDFVSPGNMEQVINTKDTFRLRLSGEGGNSVLDMTLYKQDDYYFATVQGKTDHYKFTSSMLKNILLSSEDVFDKT